MTTQLEELTAWTSTVRLADVPPWVVAFAKSQVISQLAAIRAGMQHPIGASLMRAFGDPLQADANRSAYVLAALGSWLYFDDTAYAGHLGNSTVSVAIAHALEGQLNGEQLLAAVVAADECAARITASVTLGPHRGQNAADTHLAAAVAARLHCEAAPASRWVDALSLAFSMPLSPSLPAFLCSDARLLSTAAPVRLGLDACAAAAEGLSGPGDVLDGFLAAFSTVPMPSVLTAGLGAWWHTETLSFAIRPGAPVLDAAIDAAVMAHHDLDGVVADDIEEVVVAASYYTVAAYQQAVPYLRGADSPLSALVLSVPYTVATALLTGDLTCADFTDLGVTEPARWALADKVTVVHDVEMTRRGLACDVPFGAALRDAGPDAAGWLRQVGGQWLVDLVGDIGSPRESFEAVERVMPARVTVRCRDGRVIEHQRDIAVGGAGVETRRTHPDLMRDKFLRTGGSSAVADGLGNLEAASATELADLVAQSLERPPDRDPRTLDISRGRAAA